MFRLRRWYNQNRTAIWRVTIIIIFLFIMLQLFNYFAGKNNAIKYNKSVNAPIKKEYSDLLLKTDKSVLSDRVISETQSEQIDAINTFFAYCNEGKIQEAYSLLTDECKERMYPEFKYFKDGYYKIVFNEGIKTISLENWAGNIYKVDITDDVLSTGVYNDKSTRQDYITVKKVENDYKLNINNYIDTEDLNKVSIFKDNIEVCVEKKDIYKDYEVYTFKIKNNMDNPILLDNLQEIESMYLEDKNNLKHSAYTHEIALSELLVRGKETKIVKIKYYNKYSSERRIEKIFFSKVIIDYNMYESLTNKNEYINYEKIKIDL